MRLLRRFISSFVLLLLALPGLSAQTPTWTNLSHGLASPISELNSVAFGNGLFVAIKSAMSGGTLHYATSTDGTTWTARTISTSITSSGSANRVRFLDGRFLIMPIGLNGSAGRALSLTSTDGISWTTSTVGTTTTSPDEMDFGNGRVLAVGSNNFFIGSTNFSTWTGHTPGLQGAFGIKTSRSAMTAGSSRQTAAAKSRRALTAPPSRRSTGSAPSAASASNTATACGFFTASRTMRSAAMA